MSDAAIGLIGRYRAVLGAAWRSRSSLDAPPRNMDERAFLAAALALQEMPPHPAPRVAARLLCGLFAIAIVWACVGQLDVVSVAPGRIIVSERSKVIQSLDSGLVRAIHVNDGDKVAAGQMLLELDPTGADADAARIGEERRAALGTWLRAQSLLAAVDSSQRPRLFAPPDAQWHGIDRPSLDAQLESEWLEHRSRLERLDAEHQRRQAELSTARQVVAKLEETVPLARRRDADFEHLMRQGFVSTHAGQDRARERLELERDLATAGARTREAEAALAEVLRSRNAYRAEVRRVWHDRAAQGRQQLAELAHEHAKASSRRERTRLVAPVAGTVQQLAVHTTGAVVTPAQPLMVIVPDTDSGSTVAEISIENKDIGFIRSGQAAEVKLETFSYTRYGTVPATVQWITADAVMQAADGPSGRNGVAVFPARLQLAQDRIDIDGRHVRLTPGMNVTAEVKIGRRPVIDYLLSPLQQRASESLRER